MNRYLLLILLTSWSLLVTYSEECDTGVAFSNSILSITRSTMANADAAFLESYYAESVEKCMEDCCAGKYGACSVASFKRNTTKKNCLHFNCRPLKQCKFLSSNITDSFTFSTNPHPKHPVPSTLASSTSTTPSITPKAKDQPYAVEEIATFSDEQEDLKNDNTSIKPRKGVAVLTPDAIQNKSGIKPRKGVTLEDVPHSQFLLKGISKSNVKPRKGVKDYPTTKDYLSHIANLTVLHMANNESANDSDESANELVSELAKVFEDDPLLSGADVSKHSTTNSPEFFTREASFHASVSTKQSVDGKIYSSHTSETSSTSDRIGSKFSSSTSLKPTVVDSASTSDSIVVVSHPEPFISAVPSLSERAHLAMDEPKPLDKLLVSDSQESEIDRKYKSSIHLVLSLVFGLLVLFAVLGVVAKRMYDGWQRRDYYRMNYLIDGIYNGYE